MNTFHYMMVTSDAYIPSWGSGEKIKIGEVFIEMPDLPDEKVIRNYDLPSKKQKFQPQVLTAEIKNWSRSRLEDYARLQWHRRLHGEWWFIKGEPFYIPGGALPFFDFWTMWDGKRPAFRKEALDFFWFWDLYVEKDPDVMGMYILKPRREGTTEKMLYKVWERTTRYKNVHAGLNSYTDTEASKNFGRLSKGNRKMPYFFKPKHSGADSNALLFMAPAEIMTHKKLRELIGDISVGESMDDDFLGSSIEYEATKNGAFDGRQLFTYYLDEVLKIKRHHMDVLKQWNNIKKVITLNNERTIYGKAALTSTVEEQKNEGDDDGTVAMATWLYDNSDPNNRGENGRTYTGLVRYFRDYLHSAEVDEYGFPLVEESRQFRSNKIKAALEKGDFATVLDIYRKEPETAEEALSTASVNCPIHPELCEVRIRQVKDGLDRWNNPIPGYRPKVVEGELMWKDGIPDTEVIFIPRKGGKWHISQMPKIPNNVSSRVATVRDEMGELVQKRIYVPSNMAFYRMGLDPYDADEIIGKGSDGAFAVKRRLYIPDEEVPIYLDERGNAINSQDMITNTYVCDYKYRHKNPDMFYRDAIMTCWFFGVAAFPESDKPGFIRYCRRNGYHGFLQYEPIDLLSATARRKARQGTKATAEIVASYTESLVIYVGNYIWNNHHPRILDQWKRFIPAKRTKFDLAVATGFCELADMDTRHKEDKESVVGWSNSPYNVR